jgi:hypothetical protein
LKLELNHHESTDSELLIQSLLSNFDSKEESVADIIDDRFEKHYAQQNGLRGTAIVRPSTTKFVSTKEGIPQAADGILNLRHQ